jgi:hypothetical protein
MELKVTAVSAALLGLLLVALATRISQLRVRHKVPWGDGGNPALLRAIRAHGNTAEYAPLFLLLALVYELAAGATAFLVASCAAFVLARLVFTAGLLGHGLHSLRMLGALLTYLLLAGLALAVLWKAVAG